MQTQTQSPLDSTKSTDANRDPITGEPGAHPVGVGLGTAGGAAAGAAIGSAAGPVGTLVGGAIGAVAGAFAGKGVAEAVDPTAEDAYWRENHTRETYYEPGETYDDYAPAYRSGYEAYSRDNGDYQRHESQLESSWEKVKGGSRLTWDKAKHASRAAWDRVERAIPGDSDGDGK